MPKPDAILDGGTKATLHPKPGKAGGTVSVGEPSMTLSAGSDPMLATRPRKLHDEPQVRR
jgi:hypothetical protein